MTDQLQCVSDTLSSSPLSHSEIVDAMLSRLDKLNSITLVTSQVELGGHGYVIRSHLSMVANGLVGELEILAEELLVGC